MYIVVVYTFLFRTRNSRKRGEVPVESTKLDSIKIYHSTFINDIMTIIMTMVTIMLSIVIPIVIPVIMAIMMTIMVAVMVAVMMMAVMKVLFFTSVAQFSHSLPEVVL